MKGKKYFLLAVIYVFSILFVFYLSRLYRNSIMSISDLSVNSIFYDVSANDYDKLSSNIVNYSKENRKFFIFVTSSQSKVSKSIESRIGNIYSSGIHNNKILFVNVDNFKKFSFINRFLSDFSDGVFTEINKEDLPVLLLFSDDMIIDIKYINDLNDGSLEKFLEEK